MILTIAILTLALYAIYLIKNRFTYWEKRGVRTLNGQNIIFGDIAKTIFAKENFIATVDRAYKEFKAQGCKFGGIYSMNNPMLLVISPEMLRCVLMKDFDHFVDRGVEYDEKKNPISAHLLNLAGEEWRFIRKRLTPTFTNAKLKTMFWIIEENYDKLCNVIAKKGGNDLYLNDLIERAGMDIIGQSAFGINCNALEDAISPFREATSKIFKPNPLRLAYIALRYVLRNHSNMTLVLTDDQQCSNFFLQLTEDTIKYRKENNVRVNDFLQLLIELMEPKDGEAGLNFGKIAAQAFVFFIAAYETGARSLNLILYELAKDKGLQKELREEVLEALEANEGKFSYDVVMGCNLLDMVVKENFRKNTPIAFLNRICTQNYKFPGTDVEIEAGTPIIIPVYSLHTDPEHFPNPEVFDPYRFSKENEANVKPFTYMPFGEGPRYCIGNRLGQYQIKTAIMKLIKSFEFSVSPKTEEPLILNPVTESLLLTFKQKIYFNVRKLNSD